MTFREWRAYITAAVVCAVIVVSSAYVLAHQRQQSNQAICHQIDLIKARIRTSVQASVVDLPKLEYYQTHPKELATALANAHATLVTFKPGCDA